MAGKKKGTSAVLRALENIPPEKKLGSAAPIQPIIVLPVEHSTAVLPVEGGPSGSILRRMWRAFVAGDKALHDWLASKFPAPAREIGSLLEGVEGVLRDPLFAIFFAPVLLVLGIAKVEILVLGSIASAWLIAFVGIARIKRVRRLTVITRAIFLASIGVCMGLGLHTFEAPRAIRQHESDKQPDKTDQPLSFSPPQIVDFEYLQVHSLSPIRLTPMCLSGT